MEEASVPRAPPGSFRSCSRVPPRPVETPRVANPRSTRVRQVPACLCCAQTRRPRDRRRMRGLSSGEEGLWGFQTESKFGFLPLSKRTQEGESLLSGCTVQPSTGDSHVRALLRALPSVRKTSLISRFQRPQDTPPQCALPDFRRRNRRVPPVSEGPRQRGTRTEGCGRENNGAGSRERPIAIVRTIVRTHGRT